VRLLHDFGMTAFTGGIGGPSFNGYSSGQLRMDFTRANMSIQAILKAAKPTEINTYGGLEISGLTLNASNDTMAEYKRPFTLVLDDVLTAIKGNGQLRGWPPLLHSIGDEPTGDDIDRVVAVGKLFKASSAGARTAVFTSFRDERDPAAKLAGVVDRIYLNDHSEAAIRLVQARGSECSLYNQVGRYRLGIYLYKARSLGCRGNLRFAASSVHADPYYDLDGRESDYTAVFSHPDGRFRLNIGLIRLRDAINDYRCLQKLEQSLAASSDGPAKKEAQRWLTGLLGEMKVGANDQTQWTSARLGEVRQTCRGHIGRLTQ
jgi:hypothetical protein